ncbi:MULTISPECIES: VOC family protein [Streptomyces]|uniref:VOC family protein n=2 Tax=Streptomyces TaxID=1883 RepID=A0ABW0D3R5_STRFI
METVGALAAISLDCRDPKALAEFYGKLTGWKEIFSSENNTYLMGDSSVRLGFQRVADHTPPSWPDAGKQFHLDFSVPDLDAAEKQVLELGATKPEFQPGGDKWRVYQDPAGHPFCLTTYAG